MTDINLETTNKVPQHLLIFRKKLVFGIVIFALFIIPALGALGIISPQAINKLGRYCAFAICAIGIDLVWGYAGILGLCQALFFTLGGYAMAMFLSLPNGGGDVRPEYNNIPQFFFFNNVDSLPLFWQPFAIFPFAFLATMLVPALIALVIGFFVFRSRVKGVYFTIITQAIAWGAYLAFCRNEFLLGGTNGLTNFYKPLNQDPRWIIGLYILTIVVLGTIFFLSKKLTQSRLGRLLVSIRDKEMLLDFIGYRPHLIKTFIFAVAAAIAGIGGMLYVPQNGIITPNIMRVEDSIWMVIWVALGGRGNLWGAIFGALVTNYAFSILTSDLPSAWPFIQGGMFLLVVLLFPGGFSGIYKSFEKDFLQKKFHTIRILIVPSWVFLFAIVEHFEFMNVLISYDNTTLSILKYVVISLPVLWIWRKEQSSSAFVLAVLISYFGCEAMGLMPRDMMVDIASVPLKYYALGIALLYTVIRDKTFKPNVTKIISRVFKRNKITLHNTPQNAQAKM